MEIVKAFNSNNMHTEIIIKGTYETPLFRMSDIGEVLGLSNIHASTQNFNEKEKVIQHIQTTGGKQNVSFLTERGLYKILFRTNKPIAEQFQNWACDIITEIRLHGKYIVEQQNDKIYKQFEQAEEQRHREWESKQQREREQLLLREFGSVKSIVYIIRVRNYDNGEYVIKIGETRRGIQARYGEHKTNYGEALLLDCFGVKDAKGFETFLHNHDRIKPHQVVNLEGHENEKELFLVGKILTYNAILNIVNTNIHLYNDNAYMDYERLQNENETFRQIMSMSSGNVNTGENKIIHQLLETQQLILSNQQTMATQISALMETIKQPQQSPQIKTATNFNLPLATLGARLQKINPDTFQIVRVYESIAECIKESGFKDKRPSITKAIDKNTVYNGYRWAFVGRDEDPNVVKPLAATKEIRPQTGGNVAKFDQDKQTIINVYIDRKTAAKLHL